MKAILAVLALTLAALGLNAWLLRSDAARDVLTPEPARVVQTFIGSLAAERPDVAREHLADDVRPRIAARELRAWADDVRARHGEFRYEDASERRAGDTSDVRARLHTRRDGDVAHAFRLTRDARSHLWKIAAF